MTLRAKDALAIWTSMENAKKIAESVDTTNGATLQPVYKDFV